ncbi:hypothetical protein WR25_09488 [Diploscapter pachys]|uniref:Uncharacterized protein n=1 Tax=Diploscapter pachys TaxID=2018661 RepID=A0A2A2JRU9_9BILA|nr:hypothetical protein WR25_09488 [Diploscapter pachys]
MANSTESCLLTANTLDSGKLEEKGKDKEEELCAFFFDCRGEDGYLGVLLAMYLVMALVPSDTACFDSSPGRMRRTAVCKMRN